MKPYNERSDIEKLVSNWNKLSGFISRSEWSAAIIRAATAAEIATNIAIREELQIKRQLDAEFVDHLLVWANGLHGKIDKLLLKIPKCLLNKNELRKLKKIAEQVNTKRNQVAHSGNFMNENEAKEIVEISGKFVETIVKRYHSNFDLTQAVSNWKITKQEASG